MANNKAEAKAWNTVFLSNARNGLFIMVLVLGIVLGFIYAHLSIPTNPALTKEVKAIGERMAEIQKKMEQWNVSEILEPNESVETTLSPQQLDEHQVLLKEWRDAKREWEELEPLTSRTHRISIHEVFSQQRTDLNLYVGGVVVIIGVIAIVATLLSVGMTLSLSMRGDELSRQSDAAERTMEAEMKKFTNKLSETDSLIRTAGEQLRKINANKDEISNVFHQLQSELTSFTTGFLRQKNDVDTFMDTLQNEESYKQLVQNVKELREQALCLYPRDLVLLSKRIREVAERSSDPTTNILRDLFLKINKAGENKH